MTASTITTAAAVGWTITLAGTAVNLAWNVYNHFRTGWVADRLRQEQYRSAQWERIRGRIDEGLDGLLTASRAIVRQAQGMDDTAVTGLSFDLLNGALADAQDELAVALEEADRSEYCQGDDWAKSANGPQIGTETSWDLALSYLEEARSAATKDSKVAALQKLREPVRAIRAMVQQRCQIQDLQLDPKKL